MEYKAKRFKNPYAVYLVVYSDNDKPYVKRFRKVCDKSRKQYQKQANRKVRYDKLWSAKQPGKYKLKYDIDWTIS